MSSSQIQSFYAKHIKTLFISAMQESNCWFEDKRYKGPADWGFVRVTDSDVPPYMSRSVTDVLVTA